MSHAKNVESYSRLVDICTGYGGTYNPGRQTLQLKAMRALLNEAQSSLQLVKQTVSDYNNATNDREIAFEEIQKTATSVVRMLKSAGVSAQTMDDAKHLMRLIKGRRAKPRPAIPSEEAEGTIRKRSFTHQSYVSIADNFGELVQMVMTQPQYAPNEEELKIPALQVLIQKAKAMMDKVSQTRVAWTKARMKRNAMLYKARTAVYGTAMAVKQYVGAVYGLQSDEYKQLARLSFTKHVS
ncbi:MAG: hypothetical protein ABJH04_19475 [Cyclobacteriaceae bacterium]